MTNHLRCTCGYTCASLDDLFAHHDTAHDNPIPIATHKRGSRAIGKRRGDDPYYAARDAARDPDPYDPEAFDRAILLERQREQRRLAAYDDADEAC
jgi:hypothetical protein